MDKKRQITYWINSAKHDLEVAETLFIAGKYDWCLFIAHLVLEKTLKSLYVQNKEIQKWLLKKIMPSLQPDDLSLY